MTDNGVGMPADAARAKPGLGTSIVEALTSATAGACQGFRRLPGTLVAITHAQISAVQSANATIAERAI